jgi:pyruvate,water dikinase
VNPWRLIVDRWRARRAAREERALNEVKARYHAFRVFLENNGRALELVIDLDRALARGEDEDLPPPGRGAPGRDPRTGGRPQPAVRRRL